ncbi:TPA: hypothetical protein L9193_003359 [Klebsiella aerogenes]|nr:hypothetical protein [Klebsiella aerogenes]
MTKMRSEKILLIYPTVVKPGLAVSHMMTPDPIMRVHEYPAKFSFYLTALMYIEHGKRYTTELDVSCDGKSVLREGENDSNSMETFVFSPINESSRMVGVSLFVQNATLIKDGTYDVAFRLYEELDGKLGEVIDEKKCELISALIERN